jgi:ubiquitin C-terminal hydrolase
MNTVMQCLVHNPFLRNTLKSQLSEFGLARQFADYIKHYESNTLTPARQYMFFNLCKVDLTKTLNMEYQNDMQEFYLAFFNKMCEQEGNIALGNENTSRAERRLQNAETSDDKFFAKMDLSWWQDNKKTYSDLVPIFSGQFVSQIKCANKQCQEVCHNSEVFSNIDLDLTNSNMSNNLEDLIAAFFAPESIECWKCDKCKKQGGIKVVKIIRKPKTLVLTLKRFDGFSSNKKCNAVTVPYTLTLPDNIHVFNEQVDYKLYAMGCHQGNQNGGHYYAVCLNEHNEHTWNVINDTFIKELGARSTANGKNNGISISAEEPYMFFYISV